MYVFSKFHSSMVYKILTIRQQGTVIQRSGKQGRWVLLFPSLIALNVSWMQCRDEGPQEFLQYLWIKEIGLRASETQTSRVQILEYLEERTAQTKISELLNIVIFEYSADQHMKEKKLSEAGAKKNIKQGLKAKISAYSHKPNQKILMILGALGLISKKNFTQRGLASVVGNN